jgi:hypothetical protein
MAYFNYDKALEDVVMDIILDYIECEFELDCYEHSKDIVYGLVIEIEHMLLFYGFNEYVSKYDNYTYGTSGNRGYDVFTITSSDVENKYDVEVVLKYDRKFKF